MKTYIQKWEDVNSDVAAKRGAFYQKIAEYTPAIENHTAFPLRDHVLFNDIVNGTITPQDPNEIMGFYQTIDEHLSELSLDMNDNETKMMADLYDEVKEEFEDPFSFENVGLLYRSLHHKYNNDEIETPENTQKYLDTYEDMINQAVFTFTK